MNADGFVASVMNVPVIGVAIGLMFTYLIAALVVSAVKEVIAGVFQWRGTYLQKGLGVLLSSAPHTVFRWDTAGQWLMAHFTRYDPTPAMPVLPAGASDAAIVAAAKVYAVLSHPLIKGTPINLPSYVPARDFSTALLDTLRDGSANPTFSQVERTVANLPEGDIKHVLSSFILEAGGDLDKLRSRIDTWFDDSMDRLSGIYKRNSQYILLAIGLLVAVALNVDSVHMGITFWAQPDARAQIVSQLQAELAKHDPQNPPSVQDAVKQLQGLPLPIGRAATASFFGEAVPLDQRSAWAGWNWWTIGGWLITAFAISLGAPFWFDLLQNIMNLRNAGPPPARSPAPTDS